MAFILSWQIDATIGDAVESPTVEPPINPDCKPKTLSWKLMLTKKDAMYELTVCENGCSDRTTFLKCQKKVTARNNSSVLHFKDDSKNNSSRFQLAESASWSQFQIDVTIVEPATFPIKDTRLFYRDGIPADFTLVSSDGLRFDVHRKLLFAESEVFQYMVLSGTSNDKIVIDDLNGTTLKMLVNWIYSVQQPRPELAELRNLYVAAEKYQMAALLEQLAECLRNKGWLRIDDCAEHYLFAKRFSLKDEVRDVMQCVALDPNGFIRCGVRVIMTAGHGALREFYQHLKEVKMMSTVWTKDFVPATKRDEPVLEPVSPSKYLVDPRDPRLPMQINYKLLMARPIWKP